MKNLFVSITILFVIVSSVVYADVSVGMILNFGLFVTVMVFIPIVLIEAATLKWFFDFDDWKFSIFASIIINVFSAFVGFILDGLDIIPYIIDHKIIEYLISVTVMVVLNVILELIILKIVFKPILSIGRVSAFLIANILTVSMTISLLFPFTHTPKFQYHQNFQPLGEINNINYKVSYELKTARLKSNDNSESIDLGEDCSVISNKRGYGTWHYFDTGSGFWIEFNDGTTISTNKYDINKEWKSKISAHFSPCKEFSRTECSSDPKLTLDMDFKTLISQLYKHGWNLSPFDIDTCLGIDPSICALTAEDCNNRRIIIQTKGGNPPTGIINWRNFSD